MPVPPAGGELPADMVKQRSRGEREKNSKETNKTEKQKKKTKTTKNLFSPPPLCPPHTHTHAMTAPTKKLSPAKTVYALASRLSRADATLVAAATAAAVDSCATSAGLRKERPQDRST